MQSHIAHKALVISALVCIAVANGAVLPSKSLRVWGHAVDADRDPLCFDVEWVRMRGTTVEVVRAVQVEGASVPTIPGRFEFKDVLLGDCLAQDDVVWARVRAYDKSEPSAWTETVHCTVSGFKVWIDPQIRQPGMTFASGQHCSELGRI